MLLKETVLYKNIVQRNISFFEVSCRVDNLQKETILKYYFVKLFFPLPVRQHKTCVEMFQ